MKRLIAATVLTVIVLTTYISSYFYIDAVCEKTNRMLDSCIEAYKDENDVVAKTEKLRKYWGKKEKVLSIFINHDDIDKIEIEIESLSAHSKYPKNEMFYEHSNVISKLLHQIMEDTVPTTHSVL